MLFQVAVYLPIVLGIIVIALFTLYRQRTRSLAFFSALSFSIALWLLLEFFVQIKLFNHPLLFGRFAVLVSNYIAFFFISFTYAYVKEDKHKSNRMFLGLLILPLVFTPFSLTNLELQSIQVNSNGFAANAASLYSAQLSYIGLYFLSGIGLVFKDTLKIEKSRRIKNYLLLIAFIQAAAVNLLTNSVFVNVSATQFLTPLTLFVMVALIYYAVIKHKLFDIQLIVARSVAYILSLLTIGVMFVVVASFFVSTVFGNSLSTKSAKLLDTVLAIVLAISYAPLKRFFDKITNHIFFRDAYDTQNFFDEFNKTLVTTYELKQLLKDSINIIEENIKPTYCTFFINETDKTRQRLIDSGSKKLDIEAKSWKSFRELVDRTRKKLIVTDDLEGRTDTLQQELRERDIVLLAKLTSGSSGARSGVGYLILGPKKSGNLYSSQDLKVIEIVANELVIAVQNALRFEEIENFNLTLQAKVDEATRKLRRANERLKALDETKDDFISMASHQLRTPLTSVKGYISMIMDGDAGRTTEVQKSMLSQAFASSQRMVYLIADMLNVSRLKTGKFIIEPTEVNLADMVEEELGQLTEAAQSKSLKLVYTKPKDFPDLMLDEVKIRQVIMNFADNAIYYTPKGGTITIDLKENGPDIELRVIDNGIGVPKSEQPHLFSKFYRATNARKARPDGTGLGLFMAKKVIVAQGGSIIFDTQEGKGSTFGFSFNKHKLSSATADVKPEEAAAPAT